MLNRQEVSKQNEQDKLAAEQKETAKTAGETETSAPAVILDKKNECIIVCLKHPQGIKFNLPNKRSIIINGNATHLRGNRAPILPQGGYGMTTINKDDWEYIKKTYGNMNIFKSGLIFANADAASAESQAKEYDEIKSGFEPIDIEKETKIDALKKVKNYKKDE